MCMSSFICLSSKHCQNSRKARWIFTFFFPSHNSSCIFKASSKLASNWASSRPSCPLVDPPFLHFKVFILIHPLFSRSHSPFPSAKVFSILFLQIVPTLSRRTAKFPYCRPHLADSKRVRLCIIIGGFKMINFELQDARSREFDFHIKRTLNGPDNRARDHRILAISN